MNEERQFDVVIGNPPYQDPKNQATPLWQKFVTKSFAITKEVGLVSLIHPCAWRKPEHKLFDIFKINDLKYLEIHSQTDGNKVFGVGTRYDWYIAEKCDNKGNTIIVDEHGKSGKFDIRDVSCIPHSDIDLFFSLLAKRGEKSCHTLFSYSCYEPRKPWMSKEQTEEFKYPCVHATSAKGLKFRYSNTKDNGHFGIKKVIIGIASPEKCFFDKNGKYGMTQNAFAIKVDSDDEGNAIVKVMSSDKFRIILANTKWSSFATDESAFKYFKKDFWKEFI